MAPPISSTPCIYHLQGSCARGEQCTFSHPANDSQHPFAKDAPRRTAIVAQTPVCKFHAQGICRYGDGCQFLHPHPSGSLSPFAVPFKSQVTAAKPAPAIFGPCKFYLQGRCGKGDACPFPHPATQRSSHTDGHSPRTPRPSKYIWVSDITQLTQSLSSIDPTHGKTTGSVLLPSACKFFKEGNCTKGDTCPFTHASEQQTEWRTSPTTKTASPELTVLKPVSDHAMHSHSRQAMTYLNL